MYLPTVQYQMQYQIESRLPPFHKAHRKNLALMVVGMAYQKSVQLPQVAQGVCVGKTQIEARVQRFERVVQCPKLVALEALQPTAMKVLQQLSRGGKQRLVLVLDRSLVNDTVNLLWVAVAFEGRALPLGWVEVGHEGSSDLALQQELLRWVWRCVPLGGDRIKSGGNSWRQEEGKKRILDEPLTIITRRRLRRQKGYAMNLSSHEALLTVAPGEGDPLETIVRRGAKLLLQSALEAEVTEYLERQKHARQAEGKEFRGYRNGVGKERRLTVGSGTIKLQVPRVADVPAGQEPFESKLVQPYQRRSKSLDEVFPQLFLEGLATRDFEPALRSLLGAEATLSPSTIVRLNQQFKGEYEDWTKSSLSGQALCYVWVDGIYLKAGIGTERACLLVVIGADSTGKKHLLGLTEGYRESKESWLELLRQLQARGMNEPALAIGDGALGFWAAASELWRWTKQQRCWLHKMRNILDKLPKRERDAAAQRGRAIYLAQNRAEARRLAEALAKDWRGMYDKAAECLLDDLDRMLTFYEFPAEHGRHLRTTNPIESPFASIRLRTNAMKRLPTARSGVHLLFQLLKRQEGKWQRLSHPEKLREVKMPSYLRLQAA